MRVTSFSTDSEATSSFAQHAEHALDRNSAVPLYHQLYIDLRRRLLGGEWMPGDPFPKDTDIESAYNVSRITVRQAMAFLVDGNFVVRYRGKGSFVGNLPSGRARRNHRTVKDEIADTGRAHTYDVLGLDYHNASEHSAIQLALHDGAGLAVLRLLHYANDEPVCVEQILVSQSNYPGIFEGVAKKHERVSEAYQRFGIVIAKSDQSVSAVVPSTERAATLRMSKNSPALYVERVGYASNNQPLELRRLHYRADLFALHQEIIWGEPATRITAIEQR